jgi:uncharacterized membrane protein YhfC
LLPTKLNSLNVHTPANPILYFTYPLSAVLILALAIGVGIFLTRKFHIPWRFYLIGGVVFVLSQVLHIPFNIGIGFLFRDGYLAAPPERLLPIFNAAFLGLSAGLFEEVARYLGLRWWAREVRTWSKGLLYGAGHGGTEAIIVGGLILTTYLAMLALQGSEPSTILPSNQVEVVRTQAGAYWSLPWYDSLLGFVERTLTLPVQIALAVLVLQAYIRKQLRWLGFAIVWHALLDAVAVYTIRIWNVYIVEAIVGIFAIASLGIIFALRQTEAEEPHDIGSIDIPMPIQASDLLPIEETSEKIDSTRYAN